MIPSGTARATWVRVGGGLVLADASFLAAELATRDIPCRIYSREEDAAKDIPVHFVLVHTPRREEADRVRGAVLEQDGAAASASDTAQDNRWGKAGIAGVLGLLLGARLGSRGAWWAPFLLALACFALVIFWPEVHQE